MASNLEEEAAAAAASGSENGREDQNKEKTWQKKDIESVLVVVTFMAAVAFQAGVNPPGGVWQDDKNGYVPGKSIMATKNPVSFTIFNVAITLCLMVSLLQFIVLLSELPTKKTSVSRNILYYTLFFALGGMVTSYWAAVRALAPEPQILEVTVVLALCLTIGAAALGFLTLLKRCMRKWCNRV